MHLHARATTGEFAPAAAPSRTRVFHEACSAPPGLPAADWGEPSRQTTLRSTALVSGPGLHTGRRSTVRLGPAPLGHGIVFRRWQDGSTSSVPAHWTRRVEQPLCTALRLPSGELVRTVEHLLATFASLRIDNAIVEIEGEELPIFDGGALPWCRAIGEAGRVELAGRRRFLQIRRPFEHREGERVIRIEPAAAFTLDVHIALWRFGDLDWVGAPSPSIFCREIAPARSFGRLKWALPLKAYAFATGRPILRGAHFGSTAAIVGGRIVGGMRVPQEPVRHRVLDLVGDLALVGAPILGHVTARHPSHEVNYAFVEALMRQPDAWRMVER